MGKRFESTNILTNKGNVDVIEIHDDTYSGAVTTFTTGPDGYRLRLEGSSQNRYQPVTATTLSFDMVVQNSTHRQLITDLTASAEGRFKIKLIRNGSLRYAGNVLIDIGEYEDMSYPYAFNVKATDLGTLATIDHKDTLSAYAGWETLIEHVIRCLDKTGLPEFAWATGTMLSTTANWYEDSMTTGAAQDPLALTRCHHRAFYDVESSGNIRYMSTLDVLRQVVAIMGCTMRQSAGQFRIFQVPHYNDATPTTRHYDKDGVYLSNSASAYTVTANQTNTGARLAGGKYTWLPPLKSVNLTYKHRNWTNIIAGVTMGDGVPYVGPELVAETNPFPLLASLRVQRTLINSSNPNGSPYFEKYKFRFKVGSYYLKRNLTQILNNTPQYEQPTWVTSPADYYFHFVNTGFFPQLGGSGQLTSTFDFTIPPFPVTGDSEFDASSAGFVNASGAGVGITFGAAVEITGSVSINVNGEATDTVYTATNSTSSANSVDHNWTTQIGAGTSNNSIGKLQVFNGSTWSDSNIPDGWTIGGTGTEYILQDLLVRQIMAGQAAPVKKMVHTVGYTAYEPHQRLSDGTDIWAFLTGEYIAAFDDWQGEWYYIQHDPNAPTTTTPYEIPSGGPFTPPPVKNNGWTTVPQGPTNPPYVPHFPDVPGLPGGGENGPLLPDIEGIILGGLGGSQIATGISPGAVTSISIKEAVVANAYVVGQQISVIDPFTGVNQNFTVTANSAAGDTTISVSGYSVNTLSPDSYVISTGVNLTQLGINPGSSTSSPGTSTWWDIYGQWWSVDQNNEYTWPIVAPNAGFETDENAGNGSTAGIRFDGAGLQSFTASSATPGVKIGIDGKLYLAGLATGTNNIALVLEGGVVKQQTISSGVTAHSALTGLSADDHTQYVLLAGRSGGQTIYGGTASANNLTLSGTSHATPGRVIAAQDLYNNASIFLITVANAGNGSTSGIRFYSTTGFTSYNNSSTTPVVNIDTSGNWDMRSHPNAGNGSTAGLIVASNGLQLYKSTSTTTTVYFPTNGGWQLRTVPLVGNGSTAGVKVTDTAGVQAYKSSSATPTIEIKTDGTMVMNHAGHPTPTTGLFYINGGIIHTDTGSGMKVQPSFGHIKDFQVIGFNTAWSTGAKGAFWRVNSVYAGYEVWQVGYGVGSTSGTGAGTNQCYCYHENSTGTTTTTILHMTCDSDRYQTTAAATSLVTLAAGDSIYFNVSGIKATPAQGLFVELYLRKV